MKIIAFLFLMFVSLVSSVVTLAQGSSPVSLEPLILTDEQGRYPLGPHMDILEDPSGELTIDQVTSPQYAAQFLPSPAEVPIFGYTDSKYWLRLRLRNETSSTSQWFLEANFPNLNYIDLYIPTNEEGYRVKESGALRSFDTRDIPYYHVVFRLPLAPQDDQTIYIHVASGSSMTLGFTLWNPETFALSKIGEIFFVGLFYGGLLVVLAYHLFQLYRLREPIYLYFVIFLASAILFFATYEGLADQYLWPGLSHQKLYFMVISMSLFFMASLKFNDVFLEQKVRSPRFHRIFNLFIGYWGLMIVLVPFFDYLTMNYLTAPFIFITPAVAALAGFYAWRNGNPLARYYLISWLGFFLGIMVAELVRSGFLPSTTLTERPYQAGLIWLVILWSWSLADRIKMLEEEMEGANRRLSQSQSMLSQILEGLPIGVVVYGLERLPSYINQRAKEILTNPLRGIQPEVEAGRTLEEAARYYSFHVTGSKQEYPVEKLPVTKAYEGKRSSADDIEVDLVDWHVPLEIWANPIMDQQGQVESVVAAFQDITQRKRLDAELERHRDHLEELVEERTSQLIEANERLKTEIFRRILLEDRLQLRLTWLRVINHIHQNIAGSKDLPQAYKKIANVVKPFFGATDAFLAQFAAQDNTIRLLAHSCQKETHPDLSGALIQLPESILTMDLLAGSKPIAIPRDQLWSEDRAIGAHFQCTESRTFLLIPLFCLEKNIGLLGLEFFEPERAISADETILIEEICTDITRIREKAEFSDQTRELISADERNRLARDLHDSVTQVLFAASLLAEVLPQIFRRDPDHGYLGLDELRRLTRGALADMRTMLLELRPASIIKTSLSELLTQLTEAVTSRDNLPFQLFIEQIPALPEDVHVCFYRVAQESLNNVIKHSRATQVSVSLSATTYSSEHVENWRGEVKLIVRDDGCGFAAANQGFQHLGMSIMRERAADIGADLYIESEPRQGTSVSLVWRN